jgi:hypothetical protein
VRSIAVLLLVLVALAAAAPAAAALSAPVRVTFIGDSVAAAITYVSSARAILSRGLNVRLDLQVCRRLVQPSCSYQGSTPLTALDAVRSYGRGLGRVLVVNVGYNESSHGYREGIDRVMRAALRQGARGVVWVTLRETRDTYHRTNLAMQSAARRWPQIVLADWNAHGRGKPWFADDGLHLTPSGAEALATFVRRNVLRAAA